MAQTGYTPILIYSSSTTTNAPAAGNLTNSTLGSELAINITDGKLFYKDNANAVQVIAWKVTPTTAGGTGLTSYTAGDTLYYASGTTLSKLAIGASKTIMTSSGTAPQWSVSLDTTQGGTGLTSYTAGDLVYYAAGTAFTKLAIGASTTILTSSGSAPQWTAASSVTIGTATNLAGGAQGSIPYQSAASTTVFLAKDTNATRYLANTGTNNNPAWAQINLANGVTGTLPVGNGGTGITTLTAGYIPYGNGTSAFNSSANLYYGGKNMGLGTSSPVDFGSGYTALTVNDTTGGGVAFVQSGSQKGAIFNGGNAMYIDCNNAAGVLNIRNTSTGATSTFDASGFLTVAKVNTSEGVSGSIANGATANIITLPAVGVYLVTARQDGAGNGGIRAAAIVAQGSSTNGLTSLAAVGGATLVSGAGFGVDLTNTAGGALTVRWSYTKLSS